MSRILSRLAQYSEISPLSRHFGEFIAAQSNRMEDSLLACTAALLSESNQQGNVCIELDHYQSGPLFSSQRLESDLIPVAPILQDWKDDLLSSVAVGEPGQVCPMILEHNRLYLYRFWLYETGLANSIINRLSTVTLSKADSLKITLVKLYPDNRFQQQKQAVALALRQRFALICGGPGTGKTTTVINLLITLIEQQPDLRIELTAPTGKAAVRLMESISNRIASTGLEGRQDRLPQRALTIHRLLGYGRNGPKYHHQHLLPVDCIIVDEASMVDLTLMHQLFDALPDHARVILLGDRDQLASVAAGSVLADITGRGIPITWSSDQAVWMENFLAARMVGKNHNSDNYPLSDSIVFLEESHRFDTSSDIGLLAGAVNAGNIDKVLELTQRQNNNINWQNRISDQLDQNILHQIMDQYKGVVESTSIEQAFDAFEGFRVLCAVGTGPFGVAEINRRIEQGMLSRGWIEAGEQFHGRAILIHRNDYEFDLFNGDTALLWREKGDRLYACFRHINGQIRRIAINNLPDHGPAWAMTIHKSQGSEYDSVFMILPDRLFNRALSRELLYTGITRAKNRLSIYADQVALKYACQNPQQRYSGLAEKLGWPKPASLI